MSGNLTLKPWLAGLLVLSMSWGAICPTFAVPIMARGAAATAQPTRVVCCCGTPDGRCCGTSCCKMHASKEAPRVPLPRTGDEDRDGKTLIVVNHKMAANSPALRGAADANFSLVRGLLSAPTLQARHVRIQT